MYHGNCCQPHLQVQSNHSKSSGSPFLATYLIKEYHFGIGSCGGFPDSSIGKESTCNAGDPCSIPGLGRSPGKGKGYPFQYSGLENSMDCIIHGGQSMGSQRVGHDWSTFTLSFSPWKISNLGICSVSEGPVLKAALFKYFFKPTPRCYKKKLKLLLLDPWIC